MRRPSGKGSVALNSKTATAQQHRLLDGAKALARSGAFSQISEIVDVLQRDRDFAIINHWLADELFHAQINSMCAEARKRRRRDC
jgi:hypothetical protein